MHDVLVVGGGIAGLRAALAASSRGAEVAIASRSHPTRSYSVAIQDGLNAALIAGDTWKAHAADTSAWGDGLCVAEVVDAVCEAAPELVRELDQLGVPFNRGQGRSGTALACLQLRGAGTARAAYVDDMAGLVILQTLYEQAVRAGITFYEEWTATSLAVEDGGCTGVIALEQATGELQTLGAKAVVLATGGPRRLYEPSTASLHCTGDGIAMAYRAGAPLVDMEFVQYHPAVLKGHRLAITEIAWAHGAVLATAGGTVTGDDGAGPGAFLRVVQQAADDGGVEMTGAWDADQAKGLFFNTSHRVKQLTGLDMAKEPLPVRPAMHRLLGGIAVDAQGATGIKGVYAAGECAGTGFHGAAGLDGNFLLSSVASGKAAGLAAADHASSTAEPEEADRPLHRDRAMTAKALGRPGGEPLAAMRRELAGLMHGKAGMVRDAGGLQEAARRIVEMKETHGSLGAGSTSADYNFGLAQYLDLGSLLDVAEAIAASALGRQESRGVHFRSDYASRDDARWSVHQLVTASETGPVLRESPAVAPGG
ncbi:MAG: FAD-binding protein [Chloroflexi bacterium]|nr:FAD-binding protein [Chloroflexota bacterium]